MLANKLLTFGKKVVEKNSFFLLPFSALYGLGVFFRNFCYDKKIFREKKVTPVVVSIGNVLAGGTGKTPFTHYLASRFAHRRVFILSRGYRGGDEARLLQKRLPFATVLVDKDRAKLAKQIEGEAELILLDDGLQHRRLYRDFDIGLVKGKKESFLPKGFLRDSYRSLKRCALVLEKGKDFVLEVEKIVGLDGEKLCSIEGKEVGIFSAIANPEEFRKTVEDLGGKVVFENHRFDHTHFDIESLPKDLPLICTEKDAVKIEQTFGREIYYLQMGLKITGRAGEVEKLIAKIEASLDNRGNYE